MDLIKLKLRLSTVNFIDSDIDLHSDFLNDSVTLDIKKFVSYDSVYNNMQLKFNNLILNHHLGNINNDSESVYCVYINFIRNVYKLYKSQINEYDGKKDYFHYLDKKITLSMFTEDELFTIISHYIMYHKKPYKYNDTLDVSVVSKQLKTQLKKSIKLVDDKAKIINDTIVEYNDISEKLKKMKMNYRSEKIRTIKSIDRLFLKIAKSIQSKEEYDSIFNELSFNKDLQNKFNDIFFDYRVF